MQWIDEVSASSPESASCLWTRWRLPHDLGVLHTELLTHKPAEVAVAVLHNKRKEKRGVIPQEVKLYLAGASWRTGGSASLDAFDIGEQNRQAGKASGRRSGRFGVPCRDVAPLGAGFSAPATAGTALGTPVAKSSTTDSPPARNGVVVAARLHSHEADIGVPGEVHVHSAVPEHGHILRRDAELSAEIPGRRGCGLGGRPSPSAAIKSK